MQKSPFKFLDSFTKDDRDIFFGRDKEIEELHSRVFESRILLVYGTSGTGKSSLINCGLANKFSDADWLPVSVRRGFDINRSLFEALAKTAITKSPFNKAASVLNQGYNLEKLLRSVYLDHFKPVFLIFDQFEELFIFGSKYEKDELIANIARIAESDLQCRMIFSLREEYLAGVTEFERLIPTFLSNRIRIEKMTRQNAIQTIEGPCRINNINVEPGFSEALLEKLNPDTPEVELTWLQIFLDKIMSLAGGDNQNVETFSKDLLEKAGEVKDILGSFLEEQISRLDDPDTGLVVLKSFVSVKGTRRQITGDEVIEYSGTFGKQIDSETVKALIQRFIKLRILRDKDESGRYELRHDSLATKIFEKITLVEKELLEVKTFIDNALVNYEKRKHLLSAEDLNYIAPYEDKLFLNEKSQDFIDESRKASQRARRRRQNIAIAAASVIFIVLSFFTIWAMRDRVNAVVQRQIAENQRNAAVRLRDEAVAARQEADSSRVRAEENEKIAQEAQRQSDRNRLNAERASAAANEQRKIAEQMTAVAKEQAKKAENERQVADTQRLHAQVAEGNARRLSLLATAQNLALRSQSSRRSLVVKGLLAVQAFHFNIQNGGVIHDPVIYKALENAYTELDSTKHSVLSGSSSEILSLAEYKDGIIGADIDGRIIKWNSGGGIVQTTDNPAPGFIEFVSLDPAGNLFLTVFENHQAMIRKISDGSSETIKLTGHAGTVSAAAWSSDGKLLATGGSDSLILVQGITPSSSGPVIKIKAPSPVRFVEFGNNDTLFSVQDNGKVYLWNLHNPLRHLLPSFPEEIPLCLAWDKLRKNLMAGCASGNIMFYDYSQTYNDGKEIQVTLLASHLTGIDHLVFNSDFSMLASSAWDRSVRIYNYSDFFNNRNSVRGVISFDNLNRRVRSMIFTHDNKLVAGLSDKSLRIWETSPEKLAAEICRMVGRDMTIDEWNNWIGSDVPYEKTCGVNP